MYILHFYNRRIGQLDRFEKIKNFEQNQNFDPMKLRGRERGPRFKTNIDHHKKDKFLKSKCFKNVYLPKVYIYSTHLHPE